MGRGLREYQDSSAARSTYPLVPLGKLVTFVSTGFSYKVGHLSNNGIPFFTLKSVKKGFFPTVGRNISGMKRKQMTGRYNSIHQNPVPASLRAKGSGQRVQPIWKADPCPERSRQFFPREMLGTARIALGIRLAFDLSQRIKKLPIKPKIPMTQKFL